MNPDLVNIIVGPPGTGKTTKLLSVAESYLASGLMPEDICVVTFTRRGASEAKMRAIEKFKLPEERFKWWRTLHSLAFHQLGMSRNQVMGFHDYLKICGQLGISITNKGMSEDGTVTGLSRGDRLFFMEGMARAVCKPLEDYWKESPIGDDIMWYELDLLSRTVIDYKQTTGKSDYTDLLYMFNKNPVAPDIKILIVDEAQDLTPLQWRMVEHLAVNAEAIYIAGDDDQAIFKWAGADISHFIGLKGTRNVLPQSYRVPKVIQGVAETIANNINERIPKTWSATEHDGEVIRVNDISQIDMSQGTWLLLARNVYLLQAYNDYCLQMGYVFDSHIGSPIKGTSLMAIRSWEELRKGHKIRGHEVKVIYDLMSIKERVVRGYKKKVDVVADNDLFSLEDLLANFGLLTRAIWHEALDKMDTLEREYFIAALRRGEKLLKEPRIRINTIHGVKGAEADHVVLQTDMAQRTWLEYEQNSDDEHRVWYVAVTRARKTLTLISPLTERSYEL